MSSAIGMVCRRGVVKLLVGLAAALGATVVAFAAVVLWFLFPSFFWPSSQTSFTLPTGQATVRIEVWGNTMSEGRHELVVQNSSGEARTVVWEDWGPATRSNLYLTPDSELGVAGGGLLTMVSLPEDAAPQILPASTYRQDGSGWLYLGAIDQIDSEYRYISPQDLPECIDSFGAVEAGVRFRRAYQSESFC